MFTALVVFLSQIASQASNPAHPAYACHRWIMHDDQSITCSNGEMFAKGDYRFERGSRGLVAIVEP